MRAISRMLSITPTGGRWLVVWVMTYETLDALMEAKNNGLLPETFCLILDNDDVSGWVDTGGGDRKKFFQSDPESLLRDLLDYVGLRYEEA